MLMINTVSSAHVKRMLCWNCKQPRYFHERLIHFKNVSFCKPLKSSAVSGKQNAANLTRFRPGEINKDGKRKQYKSRFPKIENFAKLVNTHYDGWSVSRVLNSVHLEMPKNFPNILDYLIKEFGKKRALGSRSDVVKRLESSGAALNFEKVDLMHKQPAGEANHEVVQKALCTENIIRTYSPEITGSVSPSASVLKEQAQTTGPEANVQQNATLKDQVVTSASEALNSTVNVVWNLSNYFSNYRKMEEARLKSKVQTERTQTGELVIKVFSEVPDWETIERKTRYLVYQLDINNSESFRIEALCQLSDYLVNFPETQNVALEGRIVPCLLKLRETKNPDLRKEVHKVLALVGYVAPLKSKGVRILTLDGGGMRGLISLEVLKRFEQLTNKRVHELFDYVCGVSTGSLIGTLTCVYKLTLEEAEDVYMKVSKKIFERNRVYGAGTLVWDSAFYDTKVWQRELISRLGEKSFVDVMGDPTCPKMSVVSTLMNVKTIKNFLFRNYNFHPSKEPGHLGSVKYKLWEATRASSAAPWYFEEFKLGDYIHQDGGLLTNNPTGIAIQESRRLWDKEDIHCVISIGTGRHQCPLNELKLAPKSSFKDKISKIVESATDTEAIHEILRDTLPASTYFRFNPPTSEPFSLDEISETKWIQMRRDAIKYCHRNQAELDKAAKQLLVPKNPLIVAKDWAAEMVKTYL